MNDLMPKIAIIGCGNVGMRYAYALMIKGIARKINSNRKWKLYA